MIGKIATICAAFILVACAVAQTSPFGVSKNGTCASHLGSYQLATSRLKIKVSKQTNGAGEVVFVLEELESAHRPDKRHIYCLDHLNSGTSTDNILVRKSDKSDNPSKINFDKLVFSEKVNDTAQAVDTGMLNLVANSSIDETALSVRKVIRLAAGIHVNGKIPALRSFQSAGENARADEKFVTVDSAKLEIDPFNSRLMSQVNERLRQFGMCVLFDDFSVDLRNGATAQQYCDKPTKTHAKAPPKLAFFEEPKIEVKQNRGVFYKPMQSYRVVLYAKDDPGAPGRWFPVKSKRIKMTNRSPILSVGVDRAFFARRKTALVFTNGALTDVCIAKGSELQGAVSIPVEFASQLLAAPASILKISTERANNQAAVIKAETDLIALQQAQLRVEAGIATDAEKDLIENAANASNFTPADGIVVVNTANLVLGEVKDFEGTTNERISELCPRLFGAKT